MKFRKGEEIKNRFDDWNILNVDHSDSNWLKHFVRKNPFIYCQSNETSIISLTLSNRQ